MSRVTDKKRERFLVISERGVGAGDKLKQGGTIKLLTVLAGRCLRGFYLVESCGPTSFLSPGGPQDTISAVHAISFIVLPDPARGVVHDRTIDAGQRPC